jgi:hypothetical protein
MKRFIGLRNIVTSKTEWKYLLPYEIDCFDENQFYKIDSIFRKLQTSFIAYKSMNGYHFVGLSPLTALQWGNWFTKLQNTVPEYFSGQTLRISLKETEKQELMSYSFRSPYLERLASIYIKRFNMNQSDIPIYGEAPKYSCVFEKYWTGKIR